MTDVRTSPIFRASVLARVAQKQLEAPAFPDNALKHILVATEAPGKLPQLDAAQREAVVSTAQIISTADAAAKQEGNHTFEIKRLVYIMCGCWILLGDSRARNTLEQLTRELRPGNGVAVDALSLNAAVLGTLSWVAPESHRQRYLRWREDTLKMVYQGTSPSSSASTPSENDAS